MKNRIKVYALFFTLYSLLCIGCKKEKPKEIRRIGHINKETATRVDGFKFCGESLVGFYHSAAPEIYHSGKNNFRKRILNSYNNSQYTDFGYLNMRFYINCKGDVGYLEVNELDLNLEKANLNESMVKDLINLVILKDNWNLFHTEETNYYMYLNFRIENGKITEILP